MKPLSWSEMYTFNTDRQKWEREYLRGERDAPTPEMVRGTDLHAFILEDGVKAIDPNAYFAHEIRINKNLKKEVSKIVHLNEFEKERKMLVDLDGIPFVSYWDGYDLVHNVILELKTGKKLWDEQRVKEHGQIYCYALQHFYAFHTIPTVILVSGSVVSGKAIAYEVCPTQQDLEITHKGIQTVWAEMGDKIYERIQNQ